MLELKELVGLIADTLKEFDSSKPKFKNFSPGIGPYGEPQLIRELSLLLSKKGYPSTISRTPDLLFNNEWAIEFKIVRPYGDNGKEAENWSVNLLHPYKGNISVIGDALKLLYDYQVDIRKAVFVIGYEHQEPKISLDPLFDSFELVAKSVCKLPLSSRVEERRDNLVHPVHQVIRCVAWEILKR